MEPLSPDMLARELNSARAQSDSRYCRNCLGMVMRLSVSPTADLSPLIQTMVNLLAHSDLLVKKTACQFLAKVSDSKSESMMLAVNMLLKDSQESNPMIRGLAMRTICTLRHDAFREHRLSCIEVGLNDKSAYVMGKMVEKH